MSGPQLYGANCATCHNDAGQGSADNHFPSLFRNTAVGRSDTNNLVMAILHGIRRETDPPEVAMPAYSRLSDRQIATLGTFLVQTYGNPKAEVTVDQVKRLRDETVSSPLLWIARAGLIAAALAVVGLLAFGLWRVLRSVRSRRSPVHTGAD
jgi:cytochrome c553